MPCGFESHAFRWRSENYSVTALLGTVIHPVARLHLPAAPHLRTPMVRMADIGKRIKKIEVSPHREPDPTYVPQEPAVPAPEKEPAKVCSPVRY